MPLYAQRTQVSSDKSRAEIERTLQRYGASSFGYGWDDSEDAVRAMILFKYDGRQVRFLVPMPAREEFALTPAGRRRRSTETQMKEWEFACRQRWRALALAVKAKLEVVDAGIVTFEEEFLPYTVLPDGRTLAEHVAPQLDRIIAEGRVPDLLALPPAPDEIEAEIIED